MGMLWAVNPKKRRKSRRKLSAKQVAAGFGGGKKRRSRRASSRKRSRRSVAVAAVPMQRKRRSRRGAVRSVRRSARRRSGGGSFKNGALNLLKAGAIGGAGAVLVDIGMGQVRGFLPANMQSPVNADNSPNLGYYAVKAGIAVALGTYGRRLPVVGRFAERMAEGGLTILAYQFMRPMVPANLSLGGLAAYFNPAPTQRPTLGRTGAYVSGNGVQMPAIRSGSAAAGKGSRASQVLSMVANTRKGA
jgi:hypothetical protein